MCLSRKRSHHKADTVKVSFKGELIGHQTAVKYLGVNIDRDLTWTQHLENVRRKCLAGLATIRRSSTYLPTATRRMLYNALVLPHLVYCSTVYNSCSNSLSDKLERVQNYAMRIILKKPPRTSSEPLRKTLGWSTLKKRRHINMLCQVHRCLQGHAPQYLRNKFSTNAESGYKGTRGENKLHLQRPLTDNYRRTFEFQGALSYNKLLQSVTSISNINTFKRMLYSIS